MLNIMWFKYCQQSVMRYGSSNLIWSHCFFIIQIKELYQMISYILSSSNNLFSAENWLIQLHQYQLIVNIWTLLFMLWPTLWVPYISSLKHSYFFYLVNKYFCKLIIYLPLFRGLGQWWVRHMALLKNSLIWRQHILKFLFLHLNAPIVFLL